MVQRQQYPIIGSLLIVVLSTILALSHFASDLHSPGLFIFKAALQPITVVCLFCFAAYGIWAKQKLLIAAFSYALIVNLVFILPNARFNNVAPKENSESLTVATFSTLTRTNNAADIVNFALAEAPDLLCLQEVAQKDRKLVVEQLSELYPYQVQNNNNQLTFSRHPLETIKDSGYYQASILSHPKIGRLRVINAHMHRPYLSDGVADSWQDFLSFIDNNSATIICGDLNITPNNSLYELLIYRYNLKDSIVSGYGFTYPNAQRKSAILGPMIRIDYILSRSLIPLKTRTVNASKLSDHRAVITELANKDSQ